MKFIQNDIVFQREYFTSVRNDLYLRNVKGKTNKNFSNVFLLVQLLLYNLYIEKLNPKIDVHQSNRNAENPCR